MLENPGIAALKSSFDVLQVAERLEADLGVTVQEVCFPELRHSFQIWNTYMGLPDKEGKVGPPNKLIQSGVSRHVCTVIGQQCFISFAGSRMNINRKQAFVT